MENLQQLLANETGADVYVAAIPGNHDCDFSDSTTIRQTLLTAVDGDDITLQDDVLNAITQPLTSFFEQRDAWCPQLPSFRQSPGITNSTFATHPF